MLPSESGREEIISDLHWLLLSSWPTDERTQNLNSVKTFHNCLHYFSILYRHMFIIDLSYVIVDKYLIFDSNVLESR